jgi:hypothetical protein
MKSNLPLSRAIARSALAALVAVALFGAKARADVALAWNEALESVVAVSPALLPSHLEARAFAMAHLAMDEAIASLPRSARAFPDPLAARRVATSAAAHTVLHDVLPAGAARFDAVHRSQLAAMPEGDARDQAERMGREAAALVLQKREGDGWLALNAFSATDGGVARRSSQSAGEIAAGATPVPSPWAGLTPFLLKKVEQFEALAPRPVPRDGDSLARHVLSDSRFFNSVDRSGPPEALTGAWSGDAVVAWNRVARAVIASRGLDLAREALLLATLNMSLADAIVAAQHWRFTLGSWRAVTAGMWGEVGPQEARATDVVASIDGGLSSALVREEVERFIVPPMPDYPSVASTIAGAAQAALEVGCKTDRVTFALASGPVTRNFTKFSDAARESTFVASLDGRHCREACLSGYYLGKEVGRYVAKRAASRR